MTDPTSLPLSGVRVLDLTRALAGPFCTMILGDLGADVIKVEPHRRRHDSRLGPVRPRHQRLLPERQPQQARHRRQLPRPDGRWTCCETWPAGCDVVVENFRPGAMEAMGLGYEALAAVNPRLIYASVTGFGRTGPAGGRPGFDQIAQGYSGLMSVTGTPNPGRSASAWPSATRPRACGARSACSPRSRSGTRAGAAGAWKPRCWRAWSVS